MALFAVTAPARAQSYTRDIPYPPGCGQCVMYTNDQLTDGGWRLVMQGDGNLVLRNPAGKPCWASNTAGNSLSRVAYQSDGNFVVRNPAGVALWASGTVGLIGGTENVSINDGYYFVGTKFIHGPC